jgi:hypothetical protein
MDLIASPKVKTMEGERVGAHFLANNTLGVEGHVGASIKVVEGRVGASGSE